MSVEKGFGELYAEDCTGTLLAVTRVLPYPSTNNSEQMGKEFRFALGDGREIKL